MNLFKKIMSIYPNLAQKDFDYFIILQNDGDGDYIAKWEHPTLPRPTDEELA